MFKINVFEHFHANSYVCESNLKSLNLDGSLSHISNILTTILFSTSRSTCVVRVSVSSNFKINPQSTHTVWTEIFTSIVPRI